MGRLPAILAILLALAPWEAARAAPEPIAAIASEYDEAGVRHAVLIEIYDRPCALSAQELPEAGNTIPRELLREARWTAWQIARADRPQRVAGCWVRWQMHVVILWADRTTTPVHVGAWDAPARARERLERLRRGGVI